MTEEEKNATEILKIFKEKGYATLMIKYDKDRTETNIMLKRSIEIIFNLIQKQQKENREKCEIIDSLERNIGEYLLELEKKDKIIDLILEKSNIIETCPYEKYDFYLDCENCNNNYKNCWKQYFERKIEEGEKDEKRL